MPTTTITVPACGIDEKRTFVVPTQSVDHVRTLVPRLQFGPRYVRAVLDELVFCSRISRNGSEDYAAERIAMLVERYGERPIGSERMTMADQKRFRVYIETRVSTVVEVDAQDLAAALEAAPGQGPSVSSNDNAWDESGDWKALVAYDAVTDEQLFPQPPDDKTLRARQDKALTDQRGADPILGVYAADEAAREHPFAEIAAFRSDGDRAFVVQIDTADDLGQLRVFVNDGAVYDADPATGDSLLNVDTRDKEQQ